MGKKVNRSSVPGGMRFETYKLLVKMLNKPKITRVLEIGAGLASTPIIRKYIKEKKGLHLALESSEWWRDKIVEQLPDDEYGKTILSPIESDPSFGCRYSYKINEKIDLVLIDGPARLTKLQYSHLQDYLNIKNSPLRSAKKGGSQSSALLEYVFPALHKDSIILVDCRIGSVLNFLSYRGFRFKFFGNIMNVRPFLRKEFYTLTRKKVRRVTLIRISDYFLAQKNFNTIITSTNVI